MGIPSGEVGGSCFDRCFICGDYTESWWYYKNTDLTYCRHHSNIVQRKEFATFIEKGLEPMEAMRTVENIIEEERKEWFRRWREAK